MATPHLLFTASFVTLPLTDPTATPHHTTISSTSNQVDSPQELSRISALRIKPGRPMTDFLSLSLPEADGKGGRNEIIYLLVLPKASLF